VDQAGKKWDAVGPYPDSAIHPGDVSGQGWFTSLERHVSNPAKGNPFIDLAGLSEDKVKIVGDAVSTLQKRYAHLEKQIEIVRD
jgi:hypothetical protein